MCTASKTQLRWRYWNKDTQITLFLLLPTAVTTRVWTSPNKIEELCLNAPFLQTQNPKPQGGGEGRKSSLLTYGLQTTCSQPGHPWLPTRRLYWFAEQRLRSWQKGSECKRLLQVFLVLKVRKSQQCSPNAHHCLCPAHCEHNRSSTGKFAYAHWRAREQHSIHIFHCSYPDGG